MSKLVRSLFLTAAFIAAGAHAQTPAGDYHQHVFSMEAIKLAGPQTSLQPLDAKGVVALLDEAGIRKATLLSLAYMFGNSDIQLDDPAHVARLREVFAAANAAKLTIVVHMRASVSRGRPYGGRQATIFIEQLLPAAPDVTVQVAHFAGMGPGYEDPPSREAMAVFAAAMARHDPRTRNLWLDVASIVDRGIKPELAKLVVDTIRQVGTDKVLYGTDSAQGGNQSPRASWEAFRRLPLTEAEFAQIARNVPPYWR